MERRGTFLRRERMETIQLHLNGSYVECSHFGSQSEGTTTPGLNSDNDFLISNNIKNIVTNWRDWEDGRQNLLMLHDEITPPQQYLLQVINTSTPETATSINDDMCVRKYSGQVLLSVERWKQESEQILSTRSVITKKDLL
ncbi:hypothetical protein DPMN_137332 [Dreissena polymorpha]|uniref:Uncharacterized protein n=1 Tax=Dreissena polymorpha TaxID=45954 RepID=A0A9D4JEL8_DREPO|nr:hypothetical protein DPMN_137332 [Dreissena polymorpha]